MNFFGHAAVAAWFDSCPAFVLGSMLPDFCGMLSLRTPAARDSRLADGIALHHATDALFHEHPLFLQWNSLSVRELSAAGLQRGAARAASHIGVELLFDEELLSDSAARVAYGSGLLAPIEPDLFAEGDGGTRLRHLLEQLAARGLPDVPRAPEHVAERIGRALAHRPRLRLAGAADFHAVRNWVVATRPRVVGCALQISADLRAQLSCRPKVNKTTPPTSPQ